MFSKKEEPRVREEHRGSKPPTEKSTTIIGRGTSFNGALKVNGSLRVDGALEGQVEVSDTLTVGTSGVLKAEVVAQSAIVAGRITGSIRAQGKVVLEKGSRLDGDVHASAFKIEDGAFFQGKCSMGQANKSAEVAGEPGGKLKVVGN
jgi:cytoskeletal protein CcmA (bactofilin family)